MERHPWVLRTVPRAAILATSIAEVARGDLLYGAFCLAALALTLVPAIHARRLDAGIPIELELVLLWILLADMMFGNGLGLYRVSWYDKALHLSSSTLIALIGFLAVYVLHVTHTTQFRFWHDGLAILLVTLGVGALWEIAEYGADQLFDRRTQGAPNLSAIDDTMFDLMMDGIGGVLGAIVGPLYIRYSRRSRAVVAAFTTIMDARTPSRSPRPGHQRSRRTRSSADTNPSSFPSQPTSTP